MIHFNHVSKKFTDTPLFKDISLFLPKASYTFITGAANTGKTTLLKMIMAYEKPDSGLLTVDDMDITSLPDERVPFLRRQIGLIETTPLMLENRTVRENIAVPMQVAGFDRKALQERVSMSLAQAGLEIIADVPVQRLDQDQRQLVACARATVHRPGILLVDEPETQLRDSTQLMQHDLLQKMHNEGATVVVALKQTAASLTTGSTVLIIDDGKIYSHERTEHSTN